MLGFPSGSVVKNLPDNEGDVILISKLGRSPGEGNSNPLQYSCLGNSVDRWALWATVFGVAKSQTRLSDWALSIFVLKINTVIILNQKSLWAIGYMSGTRQYITYIRPRPAFELLQSIRAGINNSQGGISRRIFKTTKQCPEALHN